MRSEETERIQAKRRMRQEVREAAAALPEDYRAEASRRIAEQVLALDAWRKAKVVMAYASLPTEPDTRRIIDEAVAAGKTVLLPLCVSPKEMVALPFQGWDALEPGYLGVQEPRLSETKVVVPEPELILAPCMAAAADGRRLGHGRGYYDRFLAEHRAESICLCFRRLMRDDIPEGETDWRTDRVISD